MHTHSDIRSTGEKSSSAAERAHPSKSPAQRAALPDNRPVAARLAQLAVALNAPAQLVSDSSSSSTAGLPASLKAGVESLSGQSLDHVRVHRNSSKPAQLNAHAYAQGSDIHLGPGQEKHLPHEAWHVVQQAQGRVKPTMQMKRHGVPVNDDQALEAEADAMGAKAAQLKSSADAAAPRVRRQPSRGVPQLHAAVVQRVRQHDYNDIPLRNLAFDAGERFAIQAALNAAPMTYTLPVGPASRSLSQMAPIKAQLIAILQAARVGLGAINNILGVQYALDPGIHVIRVWDNAAPPTEIFHFQVTVIPHGGVAHDATLADAAWQGTVAGITYDEAIARPFRENHTIEPIPLASEEHALALIAIQRQKASTLIQLTPQAVADLIAEVRNHTQAGTYTAKHHFVTAAAYPILDIDPTVDPPEFKYVDATFEYDVFHNPATKLWQMSHFHGLIARANQRNIAVGGPAIKGAISKTDAVVTVTGLAGHMAAGAHTITITTNRALDIVRVQVDDQSWKAATVDLLDPLQWTYDWQAADGAHTIRVEGQEARGRRTRTVSRGVTVP